MALVYASKAAEAGRRDPDKLKAAGDAMKPLPDGSAAARIFWPRAMLDKAASFIGDNRLQAAEDTLRFLVDEMPHYTAAARMLADLLCNMGKIVDLEKVCDMLHEEGIVDGHVTARLIIINCRRDRVERAEELFQRLCAAGECGEGLPLRDGVLTGREYAWLIKAMGKRGEIRKAAEYFEHAEANCMLTKRTVSAMLNAYDQAGMGDMVDSLFWRMNDMGMTNRGAYRAMMSTYAREGRPDNAAALLDTLADQGKDDASLYVLVSSMSLEAGDFGLARTVLERGAERSMIHDPGAVLEKAMIAMGIRPTPPTGRPASTI